jgi:multiple sugar transport system ATP-binding protein
MHLVDKEVIFGIRPEDVHNPLFVPSDVSAAEIPAKVDFTELMGNEIYIYLIAGEHNFVGRVDPRTRFHMGDEVKLAINMDNFHIFDPSADRENPPAVR